MRPRPSPAARAARPRRRRGPIPAPIRGGCRCSVRSPLDSCMLRPSDLDLRDRVNGGVRVPVAKRLQTMPALTRHRNPLMEISLLRHSVGALSARRHDCVHCHRTPLIGEVVHVYDERAGLRALQAVTPRDSRAVPRSCARRSTIAQCGPVRAPPDTGRGHYSSGRCGPRSRQRDDRPSARRGLRVSRGRREPLRVQRPLPDELAPAARRLGRHAARARGSAIDAPLQRFDWGDMTLVVVEPPAPHRGGRAASASSTASRRPRSGRSMRRRAAAPSSTTCSSPSRRCPPTRSWSP